MNDINRIAIDLAKNVFQVCALNSRNKVLFNKKLNRTESLLNLWFSSLIQPYS